MNMTINWDPESGNADSRESLLEIHDQTIELYPEFYCDTDACRASFDLDASANASPCGDYVVTCEKPCKWTVSGFVTWTTLNGDYVDRQSEINSYPAYSEINSLNNFAKGSK